MQGKPVIQWLLFSLVWLLLLVPVVYVTRTNASASRPESTASESLPVWLSVRFSSQPASFSIRQDDRVVMAETHPAVMAFDREVTITIDEFGAELMLIAELPETDTAIELVVEPDGLSRETRTLWLSGSVEESISFHWGSDE